MFFDLVITLGLIMLWMVKDAKLHGMNVVPYALITLCFGAAGSLLYLVRRPAASGH